MSNISQTYLINSSYLSIISRTLLVYILDGLTKNDSDIQPDTLHGDTQAQSTPVFGLAYLLGIKLMPRIRNWKDLKCYKPSPEAMYKHIGELFTKDNIDWALIARHRQPEKQVVLCISGTRTSCSHLLPFGIREQ
jgi:TnpA family transposase